MSFSYTDMSNYDIHTVISVQQNINKKLYVNLVYTFSFVGYNLLNFTVMVLQWHSTTTATMVKLD